MTGPQSASDGRDGDREGPPWVESTDPPVRCWYCGRPFATDDRLALHAGIEHAGRLSEPERERYETVSAAERAAVRRYKLLVLFALAATYFGLLFLYAVFA